MLSLLIALSLASAGTPVKPAPPVWRPPTADCLTEDETVRLQGLRYRQVECERGAGSCLSRLEQTALDYLTARQAGEPEACGTP